MSGVRLLTTSIETLQSGKQLRMARLGIGPPIVMLHGYPDNLQVWNRLAPILATRHEIIAFDWPGMGYSEAWPGGATPQLMANRIVSVLDELSINRPTVIGLDMGGQPALTFAAEHPDRIERLVVMNSLVFGDEKTSWEIRIMRKFGLNRFALRHLPGIVFRRAESTFLPRGRKLQAALRNDFWTAFAKPSVRHFISKMCAGYQGTLDQLPSMYERIVCPSLIVWAEHDQHFPLIHAERLHRSITHSQLKVISGGTHWMVLDRAEKVAECIREWMGA